MDKKKKELIFITVMTLIIVGAFIGINALEKGRDYDSSLCEICHKNEKMYNSDYCHVCYQNAKERGREKEGSRKEGSRKEDGT